MTIDDDLEGFLHGLALSPSVAVVGLGGAGSDAVQDLVSLGIPGARAIAVNTDAKHLEALHVEERILLAQRELRGRGSAGDRAVVLRAAEDSREELLRRLSKFELVFLLAGLGGGTGSALLPYLARELRTTDALPIPVAFLPFHIELQTNASRRENVDATVDELEGMGGLLLALANEKLRKFDSLPLPRVFRVRNAYLHALVSNLVDMVDHPSQLNVDLATLKTHLRRSGLSTLVIGEQHISQPERLLPQALGESLLDFRLPARPSALVHVEGGANLTLRALGEILGAIRTWFHDPEELVFGTRLRPEPREVVRLTAIVGGLRPRTVREALTEGSRPTSELPA
jgi:cell division protein FtsZ